MRARADIGLDRAEPCQMVFPRQGRGQDQEIVNRSLAGQRSGAVDIMLGNTADRFRRNIGRKEIFNRDGGDEIVIDGRVRSGRKADEIGVDPGNRAVGEDGCPEQLDLNLPIGIAGLRGYWVARIMALARQRSQRAFMVFKSLSFLNHDSFLA